MTGGVGIIEGTIARGDAGRCWRNREHGEDAGAPAPAPVTVGVRNVVAVTTVAGRLCVDDLATQIPGATLDLRLSKLVVRLARPKVTVLAFGSGKVVFTGLKQTDAVAPALATLLAVLRTAGADLAEPVPAARVVNVVASGRFADGVSLIRLALARTFERIEFDPEQFPGLVYRSQAGPVVLIFSTGSLVITGARSLAHAQEAAAESWHLVDAAGAWQRRR